MIVTNFTLGLGNQLFQYATGYALAKFKGVEHCMDLVSGLSAPRSENHIYLFSPESRESQLSELKQLSWIFNLPQKTLSEIRYEEEILKALDATLLLEGQLGYSTRLHKNHRSSCYLIGYWQAYRYFEDCARDIRRQFRVSTKLSESTKRLENQILNSNSIFLHVRRGDYLKPCHASFHGNLAIDYYAKGLEYIQQRSSNAALYIFSDDIDWTKRNMKFGLPVTYVDHTSAKTAQEDLHLMTCCRHSIVANSTFSWWGAWLSERSGSIRIAPERWFAIEKYNKHSKTLIPPSWIRI
jgi:hypothetical protein